LLTTVERIDPAYANFTISVADLVTLRRAQSNGAVALAQQNETTVQIGLPDGSQYDHAGTLDFSDAAVNATTGAVNLRALVPNPQRELLPGMYVTLTVNFGQRNNVFLVPQQALQRDTVGAYLRVVSQDDKAVRKDVSATDSDGADWIVTSGLANGDRVIVSGLQNVHEGQAVSASVWQTPAAASAASAVSAASPSASAPAMARTTGNAQ
jgi:membrane fusion protein (multidrug efflux system)